MAFARWDPICDLLVINQRLDRSRSASEGWTPSVDIHETPDHYVFIAELPGLTRDDFQIQVHDGHVTISGQRRERDLFAERYHRIERGHGSFSRTFQLPAPIDGDAVAADFRDGVLTVTCPKTADNKAHRIRVT
jgi:HSP20 family protein